jgi:AcrR family transcriptional regulator
MVRLAKFSEDSFIDAAIEVTAQCGIAAMSMSAIAIKAGAPIGSVYHRFDSRDAILARAWLRVKGDFRGSVALEWETGNTWASIARFLAWCRAKPGYAKFLLQCEACPVFHERLPAALHDALEAEQAALDAAFQRCLQMLEPALDAGCAQTTLHFLLIDAPFALVKPFLTQNRAIPAIADQLLRASHDAVRKAASEPH